MLNSGSNVTKRDFDEETSKLVIIHKPPLENIVEKREVCEKLPPVVLYETRDSQKHKVSKTEAFVQEQLMSCQKLPNPTIKYFDYRLHEFFSFLITSISNDERFDVSYISARLDFYKDLSKQAKQALNDYSYDFETRINNAKKIIESMEELFNSDFVNDSNREKLEIVSKEFHNLEESIGDIRPLFTFDYFEEEPTPDLKIVCDYTVSDVIEW